MNNITIVDIVVPVFTYSVLVIFRLMQAYLKKDYFKGYILLEPLFFIALIWLVGYLLEFIMDIISLTAIWTTSLLVIVYLILPFFYFDYKRKLFKSSHALFTSKAFLLLEFLAYSMAFGISYVFILVISAL